MTKIKRRIVSLILAMCMIITSIMPTVPVLAAVDKYYTIEKYDADGTGTMLVNPMKTSNYSGKYGTEFITSLLGGSDNVKMSNDAVTGLPDASQDDGWLDNGDLGEGSKWIIATDYNNEAYLDSTAFYARNATTLRFIYVPGGDYEKAGLTTEGADWADAIVKVPKTELIKVLSDYNQDELGGNRRKAYDDGIAMILNTTDATAESVAAAVDNMQSASDLAGSITLPEESMELYVGQKITLEPTLKPDGSTDKLTWVSSDEAIVAVENGTVKAMSAGTATITVAAEKPEVTDSIEVTVNPLQSFYITNMGGTNVIKAEEEALNLMVDVEPSGIENLDYQWSVEDPSIAEVTPMEGNEYIAEVKGKKEGTTNVIASLGSYTASFEVEVTPYEGPYVYFDYSDESRPDQLLDENNTITLTCLDEGKFVVGNPKGTTVWSGGSGKVTSIQGGDDLQYWTFINKETGVWNPWDVRKLNITVDSGGWTKSFTVDCVSSGITELKAYVGDQEVTMDAPYVTQGTTSGVAVNTKGKNADGDWIDIPTQALHYDTSDTTYNFRWVGNQMSIASGGQATMSVFMKDDWSVKTQFVAKCDYVPLTGFTIETPETFKITGETDFMTGYYYGLQLYSDNLKITYEPSNATNTELNWESLTPDIAFFTTEHNSGIVPKKCGTAKFKVTSQDNSSLTQDVVVTFLYRYPLESAVLEKTEYALEVGQTEALNIVYTPENATEKGFSYTYDQDGIVEVKDGSIVAKSAGTVTVIGTPLDETQGCEPITFTVTVTGGAVEQDDPTEMVADGIQHGLNYLSTQSVNAYGNEWNIFTILRAGGTISEENKAAYLDSVAEKLATDATENKLQPTDYVRMVLALGVLGENPQNFREYNLIEKLYSWKKLSNKTSNQISWTLIALDSKNYDIPEDTANTREQLVEWLLMFQLENGAFALTDAADVDMTGMIMQALAPYNNEDHPEVQAAFTKALSWLQTQITVNAGFAENSEHNENSCTTAQVLTALSVAGIDPLDPDNGLTVGKKNMVTNLYSYKADEGFYWDPTQETKGNAMGTQQTTYALEAYRRFANKENALYDLTDVGKEKPEEPVDAGTITVAVERFSIGQGYLIEPYQITFQEGDTYEDICREILEDNDFTYTLGSGSFYLAGIDGADAGTISIPECIALLGPKKIGVSYVDPPTNEAVNEYAGTTQWLGEYSYSEMSGWMYSVGNEESWEFPGVGMDGREPKDGDVFRLQFTVWGYGEDLTGVEYGNPENVYYEVGNKSALTEAVAEYRAEAVNASRIASVDAKEEAYNNAMKVLQKLDATQAELDEALNLLNNPITTKTLTVPQGGTYAVSVPAGFDAASMEENEYVSLEKRATTTVANLGTDRYFMDDVTNLSDCLYTLKENGEYFHVAGTTADGTAMYLNIRGGDATIPGSVEPASINFVDLGSGDFQIVQTDGDTDYGGYLYFHQTQNGDNYLNFNRNSSESAPNTTFQLYRIAVEGETSSEVIPGYVKVASKAELKDNVQILIVHQGNGGTNYVMHPSSGENKYDHVAQVGTSSDTYYTAVYTGVKVGTVTFTDEATRTKYTVTVVASAGQEDQEAKDAADAFTEKVEALPETDALTLEDKEEVEAAREAYTALTDAAKAYVEEETLAKLTAAEAKIAELEAADQEAKDAADAFTEKVEALPETDALTLEDKEEVEAAREAYTALTDAAKAYVEEETLAKLTAAEAKIAELETADQEAKEAAVAFTEKVNALPEADELTLEDKETVVGVRADYEALSDAAKTYVTKETLAKLTAAEAKITELEAAAEADRQAKEAADAFTAKVEALPEAEDLTLADKAAVTGLRTEYEALSDAAKTYVTKETLAKLSAAEEAIEDLEETEETDRQAREAAAAFTAKVEALPATEDLTLADKAAVTGLRAEYEALSDAAKAYVAEETLDKLAAAEDAIEDLEAAEEADKQAKAAADAFTAKVDALPAAEDLTLNDKAEVEALRKEYNALSDAAKAYVTEETLNKLAEAEAAIKKLEEAEADQKAQDEAKAFTDKVNALPAAEELTLNDKAEVEALRKEYNALSSAAKAYVAQETLDKLEEAEEAIKKLEESGEEEEDQEAAKKEFQNGKPPVTAKANSSKEVQITWHAYKNATSYIVYRKGWFGWNKLGETTDLTFTDVSVKEKTSYTYAVKAVSTKWGGTVYSQMATGVKVTTPAASTSDKDAFCNGKPAVSVEAVNKGVKVSWEAYKDATSYQVYRRVEGGNWKLLKETTSLSYTDKNVKSGTTYYYTVKAVSTKWSIKILWFTFGKTYSDFVTDVKITIK